MTPAPAPSEIVIETDELGTTRVTYTDELGNEMVTETNEQGSETFTGGGYY